MDEETKITLALPGPAIQRSITVEQVRAYLRSQGWEHTGATEDGELWERAQAPTNGGRARLWLWASSSNAALGSVTTIMTWLAAEAGIAPGEMLARIADGPAGPAEPSWVTLAELRDGAIFETRTGVRAVKSEYHYPYGGIECVLLASGEAAHFSKTGDRCEHNSTEVRELDAIEAEREACAVDLEVEARKADLGVSHALKTGNRRLEEAATAEGKAYRHGAEIIRKRGKR